MSRTFEEKEWGQSGWRTVSEEEGSRRGSQRGLEFANPDGSSGHGKDFAFYLSKITRCSRVLSRGVT